MNVCLIPDASQPTARAFSGSAIALSSRLNEAAPSKYRLKAIPEEPLDSRVHCTLMHVMVPDTPGATKALNDAFAPLRGRRLGVHPVAMEQVEAKTFVRDELLRGEDGHRDSQVTWIAIEKRPELLSLQREVASALAGSLEGLRWVTPQGEGYQPHFTLWVAPAGEAAFPGEGRASFPGEVPCRLAIADCGPIGQVRSEL